MDESRSLTLHRVAVSRTRFMSRAEEAALFAAYRNGDARSGHEIVVRSQPVVMTMARKYAPQGRNIEDFIQEGNVALMEALDLFDVSRGTRWMTYAGVFVHRAIQEHMNRTRRIATFPERKGLRVAVAHSRGAERPEDVSRVTGFSLKVSERLLTCVNARDVAFDNEQVIDDADSALDMVIHRQLIQRLVAAVKDLPVRDRVIIEAVFVRERRYEDVGRDFGISRQRVEQLVKATLKRLREQLAGSREAA